MTEICATKVADGAKKKKSEKALKSIQFVNFKITGIFYIINEKQEMYLSSSAG